MHILTICIFIFYAWSGCNHNRLPCLALFTSGVGEWSRHLYSYLLCSLRLQVIWQEAWPILCAFLLNFDIGRQADVCDASHSTLCGLNMCIPWMQPNTFGSKYILTHIALMYPMMTPSFDLIEV
jgi:hypothetical protein